jgi:hypothetical protein
MHVPGETEEKPSGWTVDTLSAHFQSLLNQYDRRYTERFDAQEKAVLAALASAEKAVAAALASAERASGVLEVQSKEWRAAANEWRGAMADRERDYPTRTEVLSIEKGLLVKLDSTIDRLDKLERRIDLRQGHVEGGDDASEASIERLKTERARFAGYVAIGTFVLAVIVVVAQVISARQ